MREGISWRDEKTFDIETLWASNRWVMTHTMLGVVFVVSFVITYQRWKTAPPDKKAHPFAALMIVLVVGGILIALDLVLVLFGTE